jgi:hypothetical protein
MKSPITDKTLGIVPIHPSKFRDVRAKAQDEYVNRHKSKKDKPIPTPKYKPGDNVVLLVEYKGRNYLLIEIVDFEERWKGNFVYYGIILKSSKPSDRIGRLIKTEDCGYSLCPKIIDVPVDSIKWKNMEEV